MNKIKVIPIKLVTNEDLIIITNAAKMTQKMDYQFKDESNLNLLNRLIAMGHWAPFEFASTTFLIEGCSRVFLAQITRHRLASYMSSSQQYADHSRFDYVIPPGLSYNDAKLYHEQMESARIAYVKLIKENGIDNARYSLPNSCRVNLLISCNLREMLTAIVPQRSCKRNSPETQLIIRQICYYLPYNLLTGPACLTKGKCDQGNMAKACTGYIGKEELICTLA